MKAKQTVVAWLKKKGSGRNAVVWMSRVDALGKGRQTSTDSRPRLGAI